MAVRIRLKRLGRKHRAYFRICVMDARAPRDGRTIEDVGTYDPMIRDTDKRVTMKGDRIDYWMSKGALPTERVKVLIDKYKGKVPEIRKDARELYHAPEPKALLVERKKPQEAAPAAEGAPAEGAPAEAPAAPAEAPAAPAEAPAETPAAE